MHGGNTRKINFSPPCIATFGFSMSSRNWCFTINNPTECQISSLKNLEKNPKIHFLTAVLEHQQEGTPHYQGYLELDRARRQSFLKKLLPTAHLEVRKGSAVQALTYCLKELTEQQLTDLKNSTTGLYATPTVSPQDAPDIITINTDNRSLSEILSSKKSKKGKKEERLLALKDAIQNGKTEKELAEDDFYMFMQHYRGLQYYRMLVSPPRHHEMQITVLYGPTGTGKSKYAYEMYPDAYWKQRSQWWDNYSGQDTVIIDEFYGWLPYDLLLRICDRYPLLVETKGGQVNFVASKILLTSNTIPERWYKSVYFDAFVRRVKTWIVMPAWGTTTFTEDYEEARQNMLTLGLS